MSHSKLNRIKNKLAEITSKYYDCIDLDSLTDVEFEYYINARLDAEIVNKLGEVDPNDEIIRIAKEQAVARYKWYHETK